MNKLAFIIASLILLSSCRSTRKIQTAISRKDTVVTGRVDTAALIRNTLAHLDSNHINFKTFNAKVNIDYRGGDGKDYNVNANVRMWRDSAIWISANAILGIEAMRVLITKDSVKLLDKLNKEYTGRRVNFLQEVTSLPLTLPILQDMIIGNAVFVDSNVVAYSSNSSVTSILSIGNFFKNLLTLDANSSAMIHSKLDDVNIARNRTADLSYDEYENKKGFLFSTKRRIVVTERTRLDIRLDFKQYELNGAVSFPFAVPKNYDRK